MKPALLTAFVLLALAGCTPEPTPEASGASADDMRVLEAERDVAFNATVTAGSPALDGFALSMDRMTRWAEATANLNALLRSKPSLAEAWDKEGVDPRDYESRLEQIASDPEATRAVDRAGLSLAEFAAIGSVYLPVVDGSGGTRENQAFVAEHRAEIDALLAPPASL